MLTNIKANSSYFIKKIIASLKRFSRKEILVIGDSHAEIFNVTKLQSCFPEYFFTVVSIGGATVSGLNNPNSKTQALPIFQRWLTSSKAVYTILLIGEVDTGFVIWYRAEKYSLPADKMLDKAVENYATLINKIVTRSKLICISTPLPTIKDNQDWGEIANQRKSIKATQIQRTNLTLEFNKRIEELCQSQNVAFISLDKESLGKNGVVSEHLMHPDPNDHHYDKSEYTKLIVKYMKQYI
ncbi:SGNH/GDSL hydrolase family protein [Salinisphaera sp. G21_0]|uniref:SGNH/GDSL hydrolase family protein n=1 Tax=Salinisphaera sp. G21_0 TaxID=2821094 RepID=UPI001ADC055C|nr:SGNH/GDSL hydrolase family protein [Salinisphaera sp. G21_0]MBO9483094.1 SGNH/GDSL hydrolase family protein [Salinisphaera sp. G21_0]